MRDTVSPDICIPNIGPKERQRRLRGGIAGLVVAAVIAVALLALGADRPWRLILFPLLYGGLAGVFQFREKTWIRLALRGLRDMDDGEQQIDDREVLAQVRRQARKAILKAVASAAVLTALFLLLPT